MICCAADATEAEIESEARRLKRLADKTETSKVAVDATSSRTQQTEKPKSKQTRKQNQKQSKQTIQLKDNQPLTINQEGPSQHQHAELDIFDFPPSTSDTSLRAKSSSSSSTLQSEGSLPPGTTPRQSKQSARLRRLIESGDHELGQNDDAEVRLRHRMNSKKSQTRKRSVHTMNYYLSYHIGSLKRKLEVSFLFCVGVLGCRVAQNHSTRCIQTSLEMILRQQSMWRGAPQATRVAMKTPR